MSEVETTPGLWKTFDATLVAGAVTIDTGFGEVYDVIIEQYDTSAVAEGFAWNHGTNVGEVDIVSSNGASVEVLKVGVRGRY